MTGFKINSSSDRTSEHKTATEVFEMLLGYLKRETLKPIRGAGRWLGFGLAAATFLGIGIVLGAIGVLRFVQSSLFDNTESWSWVNYMVTLVVCVAVFALAVSRIRKGTLEKS